MKVNDARGSRRALRPIAVDPGIDRKTARKLRDWVRSRHAANDFSGAGVFSLDVLCDNMRTGTIGRDEHFRPILQSALADFSALYGFSVKCARPYSPKTKGKMERAIGFLQTSVLPGRTFTNGLADAQHQGRTVVLRDDRGTRAHLFRRHVPLRSFYRSQDRPIAAHRHDRAFSPTPVGNACCGTLPAVNF